MEILSNLSLSHEDNYVMEDNIKEVEVYEDFTQWLEKLRVELKNENWGKYDFDEFVGNIIDEMGLFYLKPDKIKKIFTEEELDYIGIDKIQKGDIYILKINGKNYYRIFYFRNNDLIGVDKNKKVYNIGDRNSIKLISNKLMDYLKELKDK